MQKLQTVLYGTKSSFVKATIYERDLEVFKSLGFVVSDRFLPDDKTTSLGFIAITRVYISLLKNKIISYIKKRGAKK